VKGVAADPSLHFFWAVVTASNLSLKSYTILAAILNAISEEMKNGRSYLTNCQQGTNVFKTYYGWAEFWLRNYCWIPGNEPWP